MSLVSPGGYSTRPDGAIYVADFTTASSAITKFRWTIRAGTANAARIWRITYRRAGVSPAHSPQVNLILAKPPSPGLSGTGNPNITVRSWR